MKKSSEKRWFIHSGVLILLVLTLMIGSLMDSDFVVFFSALVLTLSVFSSAYVGVIQNKVSWKHKHYGEYTSVDEPFDVFIELKNDSVLPIFNVKINMESKSEEVLMFVGSDRLAGGSMYSFSLDLPPKSQKTVVITMIGTGRGHHQWTRFTVLLQDPLKLQTQCLEYCEDELPIFKIIPKIKSIQDLKLRSFLQGFKQTNHSFYMDETTVVGTKEYEHESFRQIHWIATAKENKLMAKTFQKVHGDKYTILLNTIGKGNFHLRKDMEELIEFTVSVCLYLMKAGCTLELWVNYVTEQREVLKLENVNDRTQMKKVISILATLNPSGNFMSTDHFYKVGFSIKDYNTLPLIIGTPPLEEKRQRWIHIKS
ncbi:DUF58 domain-containing protein [Rossellomorea marisflavi]|uniref:DUF58 domain-containing protein n=1 Tax=Rossellomorea marisflavi TaxID=189381 RepID=UPI00345A73B1